jgi:uncharacterized membrane protein (UPF0182 family)
MWISYRSRPVFVPVSGPDDPVSRYRSVVLQRPRLFGIVLPALIGLAAGASAYGDWQVVQMFLHGTSFGIQDPEFHRDIGFYAFKLPFYSWLLGWAFIAVVVAFFATLVAHYVFGGIRLAGRGGQLSGPARVQLAVIVGVFVLLKAVAYFFDRYQLLSSDRNPRFTGATYTDLNAVMPAKLILLCIAVFCAIAFFVGAFLRNLQLPAIAVVLLVLSSLLVGAAWPGVLEQFSVRPNAKQKEAIPITRSIAATRQAYGLTPDKVKYVDYQGKSDVSLTEVKADTATIPNARLLDPNVLAKTFTQLQQNRNFYGFPPKLGIDRYTVNGVTSDYLVAAREINSENLAPDQKDWINRHLVYTHGNGFVAAPANQVNSTLNSASGDSGYPVFKVSDVSTQGDIPVAQPYTRIYYGELASDYAIVGGSGGAPAEYDTPTSGFTYNGSGGVPIGNWADRLAFAAYYGERNILFSNAIGANSKIMYNRDPRDRVSKAAPWLTIDGDPYPAVVDKKIVWIVDGYTTLQNYPYAQQTALAQATNDTLTGVRKQPNTSIGYIRNSVKATVDAYTGKVTLYAVDGSDPVLKAWMGVFPGVVKPASDISPELRSHFRYPEDLFKVQRELLAKYHLDDPGEFWSASFWEVPTDPTVEPGAGQQSALQPPYYVLAADPTTGKPGFQLTSALVALKRDFLAAYVTASCDPQSYGNITVLRLPGETQTKGPQQVQNAFRSTAQISTELNMLSQQQTKVLYGNLLTLPVAGGLLYVEPVYIERSGQTAFPQLAKVLISYAGRIGYASTLNGALDQVFGQGAGDGATKPPVQDTQPPAPPTGSTAPSTQPSTPSTVNQDLTKAAEDIHSALDRIKRAQQSSNFADLGQAYKDLDDATNRFLQAQRQAGSPSSSPAQSSAPPTPTPSR